MKPGPTRREHRDLLVRIAHDVRNPLSVVRSSLEWLKADLPDGNEDTIGAIDDAQLATQTLSSIADDIDILALLASDTPRVHRDTRVDEIFANVVATCTPRAIARNVSFGRRPLDFEVHADERALCRALEILTLAVVNRAPTDSEVELDATSDDGVVTMFVTSEGSGTGPLAATSLGRYLALAVFAEHRAVLTEENSLGFTLRFPAPA